MRISTFPSLQRSALLSELIAETTDDKFRQQIIDGLAPLPDQGLEALLDYGARYRKSGLIGNLLKIGVANHNVMTRQISFRLEPNADTVIHETGHALSSIAAKDKKWLCRLPLVGSNLKASFFPAGGSADRLRESYESFKVRGKLPFALALAKSGRGEFNIFGAKVQAEKLDDGKVKITRTEPFPKALLYGLAGMGMGAALAVTVPTLGSVGAGIAGLGLHGVLSGASMLLRHQDYDLGEWGTAEVRGRRLTAVVDPEVPTGGHWTSDPEHISSKLEEYYAEGVAAYIDPGRRPVLLAEEPVLAEVVAGDLERHFGLTFE